MIEMFGTGSPMWTTMPAMAFPPMFAGTRPFPAPLLAPPTIQGPSTATHGLATGPLSVPTYGYGGVTAGAQSNPVSGAPLAYPLATPIGFEIAGLATASSLLAAVAMRRGQPQGPASDQEVEEFLYDALDLLPGAGDVEVRCENGRVTLTGPVQHKRTKRDVGEIAWAIPAIHDVQNNVSITPRRRGRGTSRDVETPAGVSARKQG
jgi:BON domain-containing protein